MLRVIVLFNLSIGEALNSEILCHQNDSLVHQPLFKTQRWSQYLRHARNKTTVVFNTTKDTFLINVEGNDNSDLGW